jgi:hypothetical protein
MVMIMEEVIMVAMVAMVVVAVMNAAHPYFQQFAALDHVVHREDWGL